MDDLLDRLKALESEIWYQVPPPPGELEFVYTPGNFPVLLSAPHAAVHTRNGRLKDEDEFTAAFSRLVAEITGAHVIYSRRMSGTDPNWYPDVPYKRTLQQIIESGKIIFVMDIHGAAARRDFGLALGTMAGQSCPNHRDLILSVLEETGFSANARFLNRLDVDQTFTAGARGEKQETVTRFTWQKLNVPAAQIEINAHLRVVERKQDASLPRPFYGDPQYIEKTVFALIQTVRALVP